MLLNSGSPYAGTGLLQVSQVMVLCALSPEKLANSDLPYSY